MAQLKPAENLTEQKFARATPNIYSPFIKLHLTTAYIANSPKNNVLLEIYFTLFPVGLY